MAETGAPADRGEELMALYRELQAVAGLEELEGQLPPPDSDERRSCRVFSE